MTEKLLTFPSPTPTPPPPPSPTSPDPGDGVNRSKFNVFPVQHQHSPTPPKIFVPGHHARIQEFFVRGGGGGRGGGSRLLNLFYSSKRRSNGFFTHFPGGSNFFQGGGPIETHITITCDFQWGSGPPIPPPSGSAHGHCGILARIGSGEPVRPPFKLRNFKC